MKNITLSAAEDFISKECSCAHQESIQEVFDLLDLHPSTVTGYHFNSEDAYGS